MTRFPSACPTGPSGNSTSTSARSSERADLIKAYIDIDGVLLRTGRNGPELIPRFRRVVEYLRANFDCYWLTTHVRHGSGSAGADAKLAPHLKKARIDPAILEGVKPTEWETLKTEAIDFAGPFIWLDDDPLPSERRVLEENGCADSLVKIDWRHRASRLTVSRLKRVRRSHGRKTIVEHIEDGRSRQPQARAPASQQHL